MTVPAVIGADENLGRRVFSGTTAERAQRGKIRHYDFLPEGNGLLMSVDRLTVAHDHGFDLVSVATAASATRSGPFRGWLAVSAADVWHEGLQAEASPQDDNPYHADIILPDSATSKEERTRHAQRLARVASWRAVENWDQEPAPTTRPQSRE